MYYIVSVVNMANAPTATKAVQEETAYYGVYNDELDKYNVCTIQQMNRLYTQDKLVCAFEIVHKSDGTPIGFKLPAGTVTMLPFCDIYGKLLNDYSIVILYKTFAAGGISYTVFDVIQKHVVCVTEKQLLNHIEHFQQQQRVTAAVVCRKQTDNTLYLRAYNGSFPVRNRETITEVLDIHKGILRGLKNAPVTVQNVLKLSQDVNTVSLSAVTPTFANILKEKRVLQVQSLPENVSLLLSNSNINDITPIYTNSNVNWKLKGNSLYQEEPLYDTKCVYCTASQAAEDVVLTSMNKNESVTIGSNVLCKLHEYKSVTLTNVNRVNANAFKGNVIDVLSIKDTMPVFAARALSNATIRAVHLFGDYTVAELARILDIRTWWGVEDITDDVKNIAYRTVKFYCNAKTAKLLKQTLPAERVVEVD